MFELGVLLLQFDRVSFSLVLWEYLISSRRADSMKFQRTITG